MRDRLYAELELTAEQKKQVEPIMAAHHQAMENWRKEHGEALRELHEQVRQAARAGDKDKRNALREKMKEHFEARRQLHEGWIGRLSDVLDEQQVAKLRQMHKRRRPGPGGPPDRGAGFARRLAMLHGAGLSAEQKAQVKEILDAAMKKISDQVLTAEQRQRIAKEQQGRAPVGPREKEAAAGRTDRPRPPERGPRKDRAAVVEVKPDTAE